MSDALTDPPFGNAGESVADVDPDDLKTFSVETRDLRARHHGQQVSFSGAKSIGNPRVNSQVWYRSSMIWVLMQIAQEQLAPWIKSEEVSDVVFRTMATIPMEWIGTTERQCLPFDVEEFFRRLREGAV